MITLYKMINGRLQLVDFGTKPDASFYIKLGYTVKVLNNAELIDLRNKLKFAKLWKTLPEGLKDKVKDLIHDPELNWAERLDLLKVEIINSKRRAKRITVVHRRVDREWTMDEQLKGVAEDVKCLCSWIKQLFTPITPAQYALSYAR
jgi:hypothetical protein